MTHPALRVMSGRANPDGDSERYDCDAASRHRSRAAPAGRAEV